MAPRKRTFDEQISKTEGCWLWTGTLLANGYGRFYVGYFNGKAKNIGAHRHAWERANRPLRADEVVRHSCDNPPCVRPDHLFAGSQGDNLRDAATKGRLRGSVHGKGVGHRFAKLTDNAVYEIRGLLADGLSQREVAARFGVHQSQISRVAHGQRWGHL